MWGGERWSVLVRLKRASERVSDSVTVRVCLVALTHKKERKRGEDEGEGEEEQRSLVSRRDDLARATKLSR